MIDFFPSESVFDNIKPTGCRGRWDGGGMAIDHNCYGTAVTETSYGSDYPIRRSCSYVSRKFLRSRPSHVDGLVNEVCASWIYKCSEQYYANRSRGDMIR